VRRHWLYLLYLPVLLTGCRGFKPVSDGAALDALTEGSVGDRSGSERGSREAGVDAAPPECPGPTVSVDLDTVKEPGLYTSTAIDGQGNVHVSHFAQGPAPDLSGNGGYHDARYSVRRGGVWSNEEIFTPGVVGAFSALGLGPGGEVHTIFYQDGARDLLYSWRDAKGWKSPVAIASDGNVGWGNDLAVDPSGAVHVVTFQGAQGVDDGAVLYLRKVGASWQAPVTLEAPAGGQGPKSGIAASPDGTVDVSLCDGSGQLKYVKGKDGVFAKGIVLDTGLGASCASDLALGDAQGVQIAYFDATKKVLRFVGQAGGVFGAPVTLDSSGVVGSFNAIAANTGGDLWVAYYDFTNLDLKLIRRKAGSWGAPETLDSVGHVGRYVSAALGPGDVLHVAHWNATALALRYTRVCP